MHSFAPACCMLPVSSAFVLFTCPPFFLCFCVFVLPLLLAWDPSFWLFLPDFFFFCWGFSWPDVGSSLFDADPFANLVSSSVVEPIEICDITILLLLFYRNFVDSKKVFLICYILVLYFIEIVWNINSF